MAPEVIDDLSLANATVVVDAAEQDKAAETLRLTVQKQVRRLEENSAQIDYRIVRIEPAGP